MRLTFENTKFKNFLSFGSKWQELEFQPGINVILGRNGSGKSSCMETIPFALFGKTHRDIVKADLINWKNRKGLEVQLTFSKGDNKYKILRAIKPDNFEIYVNDVMIEKASHVKDYQSILEDIVGTNFQTFMSLIHSNINSSKPIFGMSKPDKRKFIEKVFGLTLYSELTDKCNKKLASIDTNLREMELTISHKNSYIKDSEIRVKDIGKKLHSLKDSSIELNNLGEELTTLIDKCIDDEVYENIKQSMDNNNVEISTQDTLLYKFKNKQTIIGTKLKGVIKDIPKKVEFKVEEGLEELYKNNSNDINILQKELQGIDRLITTYKTEISIAKKRVEQLRNGKCPTCGQDAKEVVMKEDGEITNKELELKKASKVYDNQHEKLDRIINEGIEMSDKINKQKSFIESERKRVLLENKKKLWTGGFMKLSSYMEKVDKCKKSLVVKNNVLTEEYELESNLRKSIERLKDNKKVLEDKMSLEGSMRKELEAMISLENKKCKECVADIGKLEQSIRKMNDLKDYMNYIKFICKDENIKAEAIKSILPFLVRKTNYYLSEIGHPFYILINSWLEPTIKGPGITSGSYGSLSSGEQKSVDLSLMNSFLDISRIQAGVHADIHILDELLDSSLDSDSLGVLLEIVKNKQQEDNNKVYIISHRDSISELENVNVITTVKEGGFSQIYV